MSDKCSELGFSVSENEADWECHITGSEGHVAPKWTYQEVLGEVDIRPPDYIVETTEEYLNVTLRVDEWLIFRNGMMGETLGTWPF